MALLTIHSVYCRRTTDRPCYLKTLSWRPKEIMSTSVPRPYQPLHSALNNLQTLDRRPVPNLPIMFRRGAIVTTLILSAGPPHLLLQEPAVAALIDFNIPMVRPGQTMEQAMGSVRGHARLMLEEVKELIDSESWEEAQKELRKGSAMLRQDIYTIIQGKPGPQRPALRKLFSELFNGVTRLDYAARDGNRDRVRRLFDGMSASLFDFLSRI